MQLLFRLAGDGRTSKKNRRDEGNSHDLAIDSDGTNNAMGSQKAD